MTSNSTNGMIIGWRESIELSMLFFTKSPKIMRLYILQYLDYNVDNDIYVLSYNKF